MTLSYIQSTSIQTGPYMKEKRIPDNSFCNVARASFHAGRPNPTNLFKLGYKCKEVSL